MKRLFVIILLALFVLPVSAQQVTVTSPDGKQQMTLTVGEESGATRISYEVTRNGRQVVLPSLIDLTIDNHVWENAMGHRGYEMPERWFDDLKYVSHTLTQRDTVWHNRLGERSTVRDAYNGAIVSLKKEDKRGYGLDIEIRAYNEGVAFRLMLPQNPHAIYHRIMADNTEFTMPEGTKAWYTPWAQAHYSLRDLKDWDDECERPLTLKIADDLYAAIGEAAQIDFPRGKFTLSKSKANTLVTALNDNGTDVVTPYTMPWRFVMAADRMGDLLENNDIYLNLNEASQIADDEWIQPGKIMRETRMTQENSLAVIDFCAEHNMQYMLYDWKWYGKADDFSVDAAKVVVPIDMQRVIEYGKEKGIGVWVYVNQHALQKEAERIFPIYKEWGLAGIKFGFVQFCNQYWADWVHRLVRLAADNNLMVNIHDEYRPTGYSRTYPNLLTQEGILGNEEFPSATHNTILPFTRMLCGAGDYTVCYFDPRIKNTHAHQLTFPVLYFSPLQTLYWYDTPERVKEVEELEFFDNIPTVWDDTEVVNDAIGENVCIARRSGEEWFAGVITSDDARRVTVATDFLTEGQDYVLRVYTDDDSVASPTKVRAARYIVKAHQVLTFDLKERGGAAMHFVPATKADLKSYKRLSTKRVL